MSTDTDRIDNVAGGTIVGDFDADRWFVATNLNANMEYGKWLLSGRVGLLYSDEDQDAYAESGLNTARTIGKRHIDLTQGLIGFDIAYRTQQFEPYATFTYINDFGLPFFWGVIATILTMAVIGMIIERLVLRPMIGEPPFAVMMITGSSAVSGDSRI